MVDRFGRRILLLTSGSFVALSLGAMGAFFHLQTVWGVAEATSRLGWLPLVSLIVFFIAYSGGFSNVPFILLGELLPTRCRSLLGPVCASFSVMCAFTALRALPEMFIGLGKDGTFWFFMSCTILSVVFVAICLPETKGKTLEEIERIFGGCPEVKQVEKNKDRLIDDNSNHWGSVQATRRLPMGLAGLTEDRGDDSSEEDSDNEPAVYPHV